MPDARGWIGPALILTALVTAARIAVLWFDQKQLFVDEAQYWFWGQELAWGYFSKPPLIAWVIRATTDLAGSDAPFFVRLPAPLFHAATALLLGALAARLAGATAALWTVAVYLTLPLITVGSLLMTTDTVMFPFLVVALIAWWSALQHGRLGPAALAGAAVGLGFLAKYAAVYYLGAAALAAALIPRARPSGVQALAGLAAFLAVISPNLIWNLGNGLITLQHTVDNAEWARDPAARLGFEPAELVEFTAAQFVVFGPVYLAALIWLGATWRRRPPWMRLLVAFSLPIVLLLVAQASVSRAYANWAAPAYLAGSVAVAAHLAARARAWLIAGLALNALLAVLIPAIVVAPGVWPAPVRTAVMERYLGRVELSRALIAEAEARGAATIVTKNRDVLADLFYTGRDAAVAFAAVPPEGRPPHHYALSYAFAGSEAPVLYVADAKDPPGCIPPAAPLTTLAPAPGHWSDQPRGIWLVPGDCWS